jgi:uncharacterized pyridoxamine 5'-phosphate oxidase family protein
MQKAKLLGLAFILLLFKGEAMAADKDSAKGTEEIFNFLNKTGTYFLATTDKNGVVQLRPFGTINIFEGKLYIQTGAQKPVAQQIKANSRIAISAVDGGRWIRIGADALSDDRLEAKKAMLKKYPDLQKRYKPEDPNTQIFYLKNVEATIESFEGEKQSFKF